MIASSRFGLVMLSILLAVAAGCAAPAHTASYSPTVALAIRVIGGGAPTAQQFTNVYRALETHLARAGYRFAPHADAANFIVTVSFTPDPLDATGGHVAVTGVELAPRYRAASAAESDASPEAREWRQRLREIERWAATDGLRH